MGSITDDERLGVQVGSEPAFIPSEDLTIKGKHVTLTALTKEHIPSFWKNLDPLKNAYLWDYMRGVPPTNEDELWELFNVSRKTRGFILYAINADPANLSPRDGSAATQTGSNHTETVGAVAYHDVNAEHRWLEIGGVLYAPVLQRTAAATEVHYLLLKLAIVGSFGGLSAPGQLFSPTYRRVLWKCNRLNKKSRRAAERMGFVYEGTLRNHMIIKGRSRDSDMLSITDDDWPLVKAAFEAWLDDNNFDAEGKQKKGLDEIRAALRSGSTHVQ